MPNFYLNVECWPDFLLCQITVYMHKNRHPNFSLGKEKERITSSVAKYNVLGYAPWHIIKMSYFKTICIYNLWIIRELKYNYYIMGIVNLLITRFNLFMIRISGECLWLLS